MNATWCWLILRADPPSERWVCFRTRDEQREHKRRFGGVLYRRRFGGVLYRVERMH